MKALIILAIIILYTASGCASLTSSEMQSMVLETKHNDHPESTVCTAENSRGEYILVPGKPGKVRRSRDALHIECTNQTQFGYQNVDSRRRNGTKFVNFMLDFCSISCTIDRKTGKGYGYTPRQTVYMMESRK